ncbi:hypothetical protein QBC38DRAFT_211723 [Podospora fimiseda]|uniref:Uncharacterized protein n=1 Tax=Podospora fimiseda TaxID=252190 RepID=A0AAN7BP49_9PEZI|nr:hypothetical protein QBC38DRAFT_211723 [Podospora fimiseda]
MMANHMARNLHEGALPSCRAGVCGHLSESCRAQAQAQSSGHQPNDQQLPFNKLPSDVHLPSRCTHLTIPSPQGRHPSATGHHTSLAIFSCQRIASYYSKNYPERSFRFYHPHPHHLSTGVIGRGTPTLFSIIESNLSFCYKSSCIYPHDFSDSIPQTRKLIMRSHQDWQSHRPFNPPSTIINHIDETDDLSTTCWYLYPSKPLVTIL